MQEWLTGLPGWLVAGLAIGVAFTVVAAVAFLAGTRLFPEPARARGPRVAGDGRRRAEIRDYLRDVDERYAEDHPVGGQPVAFYLPERDVAITFDARAYFRIDGTGTAAVLVEHELPGAALGPRLPFETPAPDTGGFDGHDDPGFGGDGSPAGAAGPGRTPTSPGDGAAATAHDPSRAAFDALGLPADADLAAVKTAYRERVKTVHPDQGGDPAAFRRLREAYTVAKEAAESPSSA